MGTDFAATAEIYISIHKVIGYSFPPTFEVIYLGYIQETVSDIGLLWILSQTGATFSFLQ